MKRILALLLTVLLICSMVACNADDTENPALTPTHEPVAVDHVWKSEYYHYPENVRGTPNPYTLDGNTLRFSGVRVLSEEPYEYETVDIAFDLSTHSFTVTATDTEQAPRAQMTLVHNDGTLRLNADFDEVTHEETYTLRKTDSDGNPVWELDAQAQFQKLAGGRPWFSVRTMTVHPTTGTIYLATEQNIAAISPDGKRLYELVSDDYFDNVFAADDAVYVITNQRDPDSGTRRTVFLPIDDTKQDFGTAITVPDTVDLLNADIHAADGYDLFYTNDIGLYGWNMTDTEPTILCNWINSDMTGRDTGSLILISSTMALRTAYDPVDGSQQLCVMTPLPPEEVVPKYLITVAYTENGGNDMQSFAVAFNRESEQYRVVLKDYSQYYNGNATPAEVLSREIVAGDIPDIIVDSYMDFDTANLAEKGLFLDLYSFLDAPDAAVTRDAFLPCVLKPFELSDGSLPWLVSGFTLQTIYGNRDVLGDKQVWSLDDIMALEKTLADDQYLFSLYLDAMREDASAAVLMLDKLLPFSLSTFLDGENGTCSFDDGRFSELLQFCNTVRILDAAALQNGTAEKFRDGTLLLLEDTYISEISSYLKTKYYDFGGENMTVIGYPTADADAVSGTAIHPLRRYCITKDSPVADGAWEFILRTFGDTDGDRYYHRTGFPPFRAALDRMFEEESRSYYVFRENGWSGTSVAEGEEFNIDEQEWLQDEIKGGGVFGHMSEEDEAELRAILESVTLTTEFDEEIMSLIREDASAYFAGAKSLEETVKVIQSRVSIYVAEHS
ncbi:MAG: extracellular solute-binding protein [Clostridia bacterium]|nr:extracellular solute-binding protein [Clostridia bacterium]